jgi:hypothetical protein
MDGVARPSRTAAPTSAKAQPQTEPTPGPPPGWDETQRAPEVDAPQEHRGSCPLRAHQARGPQVAEARAQKNGPDDEPDAQPPPQPGSPAGAPPGWGGGPAGVGHAAPQVTRAQPRRGRGLDPAGSDAQPPGDRSSPPAARRSRSVGPQRLHRRVRRPPAGLHSPILAFAISLAQRQRYRLPAATNWIYGCPKQRIQEV